MAYEVEREVLQERFGISLADPPNVSPSAAALGKYVGEYDGQGETAHVSWSTGA